MSEYWKSTPKHWCKHCGVFVRDTKLERSNHEATGKHQNNLRKFLKNVHQKNEKLEREASRAKEEVSRLNYMSAGLAQSNTRDSVRSQLKPQVAREATKAERQEQIDKLATMGVAIPEEYRQGMAMAGEWKTISETPPPLSTDQSISLETSQKHTKNLNTSDPIATHSSQDTSFFKKAPMSKRPHWNSAPKTIQDSAAADLDLEALLKKPMYTAKSECSSSQADILVKQECVSVRPVKENVREYNSRIAEGKSVEVDVDPKVDAEDDEVVVFKKRKVMHRKML